MPIRARMRRFIAAGLCLYATTAAGVRAAPAPASDTVAIMRFAVPLERTEMLAVEHSPDVEVARAAVEAAAAALRQARDTNGLSAIVGYTELPQSGGEPFTTWSQRLGAFELEATLGDVAAVEPLAAQASAILSGAITDELVAERDERLKAIGLYFAAIQARSDLLAKRDAVDRALDFENGVSARFSRAKVPYLDLLRAEVALSKARADAAVAQGVDANATQALAAEIGLTIGDLRATVSMTSPEFVVMDADRAIARAFAQRPEIRSAEQGVRAARAGLAAAHRAVIPPITVAGGYVHGVDAGTVVGGPVVSASVQIPLSHIAADRIAAQSAAERTALAKEQSVRRALTLEVGAAAHTAAAAIIARDETDNTLEAATSTLTFASMEYEMHPSLGLSVSDARAIYDQAVIDDIAAQYAALQAQATLDVELSP